MNTRILLVEDEENLLDAIKLNLELEGYEVETAETGTLAVKKAEEQYFNLLILDVMLPELDGYEVCQKIRLADNDTPILFLTARNSDEDRIAGLKSGADDYLVKPFNLEELLLRVKVLVRHSLKGTAQEAETQIYKFGNNEINFVNFTALTYSGEKMELSKKETALLKLLIDRKNTVVSRNQILQYVWGYDIYPSTRTIDNFILSFRKYFEKDAKNPVFFHSVRGVGYKFND
ncbi:MAG TPA: response regulator transcription factor [Chitinophagales bacterium]